MQILMKNLLLCILLLPAVASAEDGLSGSNTAWILTSTALVLFMTLPGLALFYGGLVRTKNVLSVLMQCFAIGGIVTILWLVVGYSLAFGEGNAWIGDFSKVIRTVGKSPVTQTPKTKPAIESRDLINQIVAAHDGQIKAGRQDQRTFFRVLLPRSGKNPADRQAQLEEKT